MQRPDAPQSDAAQPRPWLRRFCGLTIVATFLLIAMGGKVTSYEYGMAIPEGWTTGGVISLLAHPEYWLYDTDKFWEHSHRIMGSLVGFLAIGMMVWLWRTQSDRPWLKWIGVAMLVMVCIQGALGATRVDKNSLAVAFVHGIGGQLILCGWVLVMAALSGAWRSRRRATATDRRDKPTPRLRIGAVILLVLLMGQLTLGSAVRHFKADKAYPEVLSIYGQVLPPMSQEALDQRYISYHTERLEASGSASDRPVVNRYPDSGVDEQLAGKPVVRLLHIDLRFAHLIGAFLACTVGLLVAIGAIRRSGDKSIVFAPAMLFLMLLAAQFSFGVFTVISGTEPAIATLHQATGAALIAVATWLAVRIHLAEYPVIEPAAEPTLAPAPAAAPPRQARPAPATASA